MTTAPELARLRQGLYRFFSASFATPEPVMREQLSAAAAYFDELDLRAYAFSREWRALVGAIESDASVEVLGPEHVRLFASGTGGLLCPPLESFYRVNGRHEAIAGVVTAIRADYRKIGVDVVAAGDSPDHICIQLEIMSMLCGREAAAWDAGQGDEPARLLDAEARFLRRHLAGWVPQLRIRAHRATPLPFYRALVDALHAFLVHDGDLVADLRRWSQVVA